MAAGAAVAVFSGDYLVRNYRALMDELVGLASMKLVGVAAGLMVVIATASLYEQLAVGIAA